MAVSTSLPDPQTSLNILSDATHRALRAGLQLEKLTGVVNPPAIADVWLPRVFEVGSDKARTSFHARLTDGQFNALKDLTADLTAFTEMVISLFFTLSIAAGEALTDLAAALDSPTTPSTAKAAGGGGSINPPPLCCCSYNDGLQASNVPEDSCLQMQGTPSQPPDCPGMPPQPAEKKQQGRQKRS
jgi:hypothetical protein